MALICLQYGSNIASMTHVAPTWGSKWRMTFRRGLPGTKTISWKIKRKRLIDAIFSKYNLSRETGIGYLAPTYAFKQ